MKAIRIIFTCLLVGLTYAYADPFKEAIEAYENHQYAEAIDRFSSDIENNETAAARHNLALSHFQAGNPAEAAWQIERALRIAPLNTEYHYKLGILRQQLGLFEARPEWYQVAALFLRPETWIIIACVSFWIGLAAWALPRIGGLKPSIAIGTLQITCLLALLICLPAIWENYYLNQNGIVVSNEPSDLHAAPASAAPTNGIARSGERARIIDKHENFYKVETEANVTGWISKDYFRSLSASG